MPSTALDASVMSDKDKLRLLVQATPHCRLDYCNVILAGTADIVIKQLQSQNTAARFVSGTIFRDHYHYIRTTQPPLASDVAQNRFQEHSPVSPYKLCVAYWLIIFDVVLGCGHQLDIQCQIANTSVGYLRGYYG